MIALKFAKVDDEVLEELERLLQEQEIADLDADPEPGPDGDTPPDPDSASFEGDVEETLDHIEERLARLERTARDFAEPMGGDPRFQFEVQLRGGGDTSAPLVSICLVLESPASPEKRLYFCDSIARVDEDRFLTWDLPEPRTAPFD